MGIPGNNITDEEAKAAVEDDLSSTKKIQDLSNWIKIEDKKTRKTRLQISKTIKKK
jgi:hypothetical protein